jgi:hypothetical protein
MAARLYQSMSQWVSWLPGGLMHADISACMAFAATSGSSVATAVKRYGYDERLFLGSLAAGGTLGFPLRLRESSPLRSACCTGHGRASSGRELCRRLRHPGTRAHIGGRGVRQRGRRWRRSLSLPLLSTLGSGSRTGEPESRCHELRPWSRGAAGALNLGLGDGGAHDCRAVKDAVHD